ncbi:MAG: NRDE family protein [Burkholderiaceae bacterium]
MCLITFALDTTAGSFVLAANRDEYYARPTVAAHWWQQESGIFAGRDGLAGGTWLAVNQQGRLATLTNYREPGHPPADSPSRGELVLTAVRKNQPVQEIIDAFSTSGTRYAGYNLLVFDWTPDRATGRTTGLQAWYLSNRAPQPVRALQHGVYGLSNGLLDDPWPKSQRLKQTLSAALGLPGRQRDQHLLDALTDRSIASDHLLPDTGIGLTREQDLAPAFIRTVGADNQAYGTRSSAIVQLDGAGQLDFTEWSWQVDLQASRNAADSALSARCRKMRVHSVLQQ